MFFLRDNTIPFHCPDTPLKDNELNLRRRQVYVEKMEDEDREDEIEERAIDLTAEEAVRLMAKCIDHYAVLKNQMA